MTASNFLQSLIEDFIKDHNDLSQIVMFFTQNPDDMIIIPFPDDTSKDASFVAYLENVAKEFDYKKMVTVLRGELNTKECIPPEIAKKFANVKNFPYKGGAVVLAIYDENGSNTGYAPLVKKGKKLTTKAWVNLGHMPKKHRDTFNNVIRAEEYPKQ